jgi:hypothetical protein
MQLLMTMLHFVLLLGEVVVIVVVVVEKEEDDAGICRRLQSFNALTCD